MATSFVIIRVDSKTKKEATRVADYFGFDLPSITRAFYKQMIREYRIPLTLSGPEPNEESLQAIRETEEILRSGSGKSYTSAEEMFQAIFNE